MALTLLDVARHRKDNFERGVIETWVHECDLLKILPIETIGTVETKDQRTNSIGSVGWRKRSEAFPAAKGGTHDEVADSVYSMGTTIDIDKTDYKDKKLTENPLTVRVREFIKAMTWEFNDVIINGDHATEEDAPEGLKVRLATMSGDQTLYGDTSSADLDVYGDLTGGTTTALQTFFDRMDEAAYALDGHKADFILTRHDGIKAIKAAKRRLNIYKDTDPEKPHVKTTQRRSGNTSHGDPGCYWDDVPVYDMGLKADQTNYIIDSDTIGGEPCAPFYFVKKGKPYFHVIQQYAMEVDKPFLLENRTTYRTVLDWPIGFHHVHPKSLSVLKGVRTLD